MAPTGVQPEDAKYIKRRVKSGSIDVHPTEPALIVNYEVEAIILGETENPVLSDKKECQKLIRIKSLNKNSDCATLAREVVQKCTLIHPAKVKEVEHLICFLQSRKDNAFSEGAMSLSQGSNMDTSFTGGSVTPEKASFARLEEYLELLYEEMPDKIRGSAMILQLSRDKDNLEEIARNEGVINALARVLREDYKKSMDLSTNIISTFQSFSQFSSFHPLLLQYKVGSSCIAILEYELNHFMQMKAEASAPRESRKEVVSRLPLPKRSSTPSPAPSVVGDRKRLSLTPNIPKTAGPIRSSSRSGPSTPDEDNSQKRFTVMVNKQNRLLKAIFSLLLNIAENIKVEDKIRKRNIVSIMSQCLERNYIPLLTTVAKFLMKLSLRVENKDEMANLNIIDKIPKLLLMNNEELEKATLGLLFNLSFDSKLRDRMVRVGFLQKFVSLLGDERHTKVTLKLLYHLSMDDRVKAMFPYTECLPKLMKMVTNGSNEDSELVIALCINVALNPRCAEVMSTDNGFLDKLINKAFHQADSLLMKIVRNLSTHDSTVMNILPFAEDIIKSFTTCDDNDFLLESIGTVANLPLHKIDIANMMEQYKLIPWIQSFLIPGKFEDDIVLEVVMMIAAAAGDEACAKIFCKADLLAPLIELLKSKQEDDEMVLQILLVFYQISRHGSTKNYLTNETEAAAYLIDLMNDNNPQIRVVCDACIDIIKEDDQNCEEKVKGAKFKWYNSDWLAMVEAKQLQAQQLQHLSAPGLSAVDMEAMSMSSCPDFNEALPHYDLLDQSLFQNGSSIDDIEIVSNNPNSDEGSRPLSRYDSEGEDYSDAVLNVLQKVRSPVSNEEMMRNVLNNLVIQDDTSSEHKYFHLDSANTQMTLPE